MLYFSLVLSTVLLVYANRAMRRSAHPGAAVGCASLSFVAAPVLMTCLMPALAMQSLFLWLAVMLCTVRGRDASCFLRLSLGATALAYGLAGILVFKSERAYERLRALYPYESMESRLPARDRILPPPGPPPTTEARLAAIEAMMPDDPGGLRGRQLRRLHEETLHLFINSPGFGISRMFLPAEWNLRFGLRQDPVPAQPGPRFDEVGSPGEWMTPAQGDAASLGSLLEASVFNFVNWPGFGFFKDRRHVAGFEAHRFSEVPAKPGRWEVQNLELVSLLLHDEPAVYVSDRLPAMNRTYDLPTRPLERFERVGLDALVRGDDLFVSQTGTHLRMLGAIRSVKQCVACHGGERGDLLGAFSYSLSQKREGEVRTEPRMPDDLARPSGKRPSATDSQG